MNIYQKYAQYALHTLKIQKEMQIQKTDLIYLIHEINDLTVKITKSTNPGWFQVSLVDEP